MNITEIEQELEHIKKQILELYESQRPLKMSHIPNVKELNRLNLQIFNLREKYKSLKQQIILYKQEEKEAQIYEKRAQTQNEI